MKFTPPFIILFFFSFFNFYPQGRILLVLGSDTAIWDAMDVSSYNCQYNFDLFTNPSENTNVVMSSDFRNNIIDSYGNPLKMTWWMMAGNIFRYAINNNIPLANTMTLYLMKKYYGDKIELWGDELSLHYHTFGWTDYDSDGKYWWNQTQTFLETKEDFDFTLAQFLVEENIFPVSFRSGWHYMDNEWQMYLNKILPYSLHNDWPAIHTDLTEPLDNNFDWSQAPSEFITYHPSDENYQLPGNGKGWNVRSKYMGSVNSQLVNEIFTKASQGIDQVVCLWSHLPDDNFLTEIQQVNNLFHQVSTSYPGINFKYCTAIEAYQLWLNSTDSTAPLVNIEEEVTGADVKYIVTTDEEIFQEQPFFAVKDIYERYSIAEFENVSQNTWKTKNSYLLSKIGKVGTALTDTVGNLTTKFITYLPDDKFVDNKSSEYDEVYGIWSYSDMSSWDVDSRKTILGNNDSAKVKWDLNIDQTGLYNIFIQFPETENFVDSISFFLSGGGFNIDTVFLTGQLEANKWIYVSTAELISGQNNYIEMYALNKSNSEKILYADVLKLSAYVRDIELVPDRLFIELDEVSVDDSIFFNIELNNIGINDLVINNITSVEGNIGISINLPLTIKGMSGFSLPLEFVPSHTGIYTDTVLIQSNDPLQPELKIPFVVNVLNYFSIIDNENSASYDETGDWFTSVAQAYGNSSRYAYINSGGAQASLSTVLNYSGIYDIYEIVPATVNSADNALYEISVGGIVSDSVYKNQNEGSGSWKLIGRYYLPASVPITVKVIDSGESTQGPVLRADAVRFSLSEGTNIENDKKKPAPHEFVLKQNYPNPFNPLTVIKYSIPASFNGEISKVNLKVFDILGNEVSILVNKEQPAGEYEVIFDGASLSSGIYFYCLSAGSYSDTKKLVLIK